MYYCRPNLFRLSCHLVVPVLIAVLNLNYSEAQTKGSIAVPGSQDVLGSSTSLTLDKAISLAFQVNPLIKKSQAEIRFAMAASSESKSSLSPKVSLNGFASSGNYRSIGMNSPGVFPTYLLTLPAGEFEDINLMLMLPISTGNKFDAQIANRKAQIEAAIAQDQETIAEVRFQVTKAYLSVLLSKELVKTDHDRTLAASQMAINAQSLYTAGKTTSASVDRSKAEEADAEKNEILDQGNVQKNLIRLNLAIGQSPTSDIDVSDSLHWHEMNLSEQGSLDQASTSRPALGFARDQVKESAEAIREVVGKFKPQIYGFAMTDLASKGRMGSGSMIGLTLSFPIYNAGEGADERHQAESAEIEAKANLDETKLDVDDQVAEAWEDIKTSNASLIASKSAIVEAESAYKIIAQRVEFGKSILSEQLDSLASVTRAKYTLAQAIYDHELAVAELERAMGIQIKGDKS